MIVTRSTVIVIMLRLTFGSIDGPDIILYTGLPDIFTLMSESTATHFERISHLTAQCRVNTLIMGVPPLYPCGVISPPSPPPRPVNWTFTVHTTFHIKITLLGFHLTDSLEGCRVEGVRISWPAEDGRSSIYQPWEFGPRFPWSVYVPGNESSVEYQVRKGLFRVQYQLYRAGAVTNQSFNLINKEGTDFSHLQAF